MRTLVMVIGALITLIGLSQITAASWWVRILPSIMAPQDAVIFGVIVILIGAILILAVLRRAVALRPFVLVLGLLMLIGGIALTLNPVAMRNVMYAIFLSRPHGAQITITVLGGVIRAVIGLLLIYAAVMRSTPRVSTYRGAFRSS